MEIRPIKTDADYDAALRRIEEFWGTEPGTLKGDELDVLVTLVEAYEKQNFPIDIPDPIDAIKFRLEQDGKDYSALIGVIGQRTRVYEVMRRSRPLSLNMIRRLHARLAIPAEVLIQATPKKARPSLRRRIRTSSKARSVRRPL
jgi:HTH-type transcriptional regulator / antitoxin HigA